MIDQGSPPGPLSPVPVPAGTDAAPPYPPTLLGGEEKKNSNLATIISAIALATSIISAYFTYWTFRLNTEEVTVSIAHINDDSNKIKLTLEGVRWTERYFIVNNANIDTSITDVYCSNEEIEWRLTTQRQCNVNIIEKTIPFVIKAGSIEQLDSTIVVEPKAQAFSVLKNLLKTKPDATAMDYSGALLDAYVDIDGKTIAVDHDLSPGHVYPVGGFGTGADSYLKIYNVIFSHINQGQVIFVETGRNNTFRSPHFKLFMPSTGF